MTKQRGMKMSEKKEKENRELVITITAGSDGGLKWEFNRKDVIEQQFLDILRIVEDQILLERAVREVKKLMMQDARMHLEANKILRARH